jgi:hypothetical protein
MFTILLHILSGKGLYIDLEIISTLLQFIFLQIISVRIIITLFYLLRIACFGSLEGCTIEFLLKSGTQKMLFLFFFSLKLNSTSTHDSTMNSSHQSAIGWVGFELNSGKRKKNREAWEKECEGREEGWDGNKPDVRGGLPIHPPYSHHRLEDFDLGCGCVLAQ